MVTLRGKISGPGDQGQGGDKNPANEEHAPSPLTANRTGSSLAPSSPISPSASLHKAPGSHSTLTAHPTPLSPALLQPRRLPLPPDGCW